MNLCSKYYLIIFISFMNAYNVPAQYGDPVLNQTFGEGNSDPNTIGPPLHSGATDFSYSTDLCPQPGSYTLARRINLNNCFNNEWIPLSVNHTPFDDFGMMMIVNNNETTVPKIVYKDTINKTLCPGTVYHYSFAVINIDSVSTCRVYFPVFELRLEDGNGKLIKNDTTLPLQYAVFAFGYHFAEFGFDFVMPTGANKLVAKLLLLPSKYSCGEDFAVDDIVIAPEGPRASVIFTNEFPETIVKFTCFKDNQTISMSGHISSYYNNPALQWQLSKDSGITWNDVQGAKDYTYSRTFPAPDTFYFRLTAAEADKIDNPHCRVTSNFIRVQVDSTPTNFNATNSSPLCAGQDLKFNAEGGATYTWTGPNEFYAHSPYPHIYSSRLEDSGTYYVQITTQGGCTATDSTRVIMKGTDVHASPDTSVCNGAAVTLHASKGSSYTWSPSNGLSNISTQSPIAKPVATTKYTVKIISQDGCSDTASVTIKILNSIPAKATFASTNYLCRPVDSASFKNMSLGHITKWEWSFGNGQNSSLQNPPSQFYHISNSDHNYIVSLKVTDTAGCSDSSYQIIKVADNCYIDVPTAFTPNGDGLNDYLYPLNAYKATNLLFRVYNRIGQLMFETKDWTKKWNGTTANIKQPPGTYLWMLDYNDASNKRISLRGTTVLIR